MEKTFLNTVKMSALILGSALVLAGCGAKKTSDTSDPTGRGESVAQQKVAANRDLKSVCDGQGVDGAAAYDPAKPGVHATRLFVKSEPEGLLIERNSQMPEEWDTAMGDLAKTELVGCAVVKESKMAKECEFENKKEPGKKSVLELHDATYSLALFEAKTGKQVAQKDVNIKAPTECPIIHFFFKEREVNVPDLKKDVETVFAPAVVVK